MPWGHHGHEDVMLAGAHRLTYCPEDGHRRYTHDVTPDTAAFLAACNIAQYAMEQAIAEKAKAAPQRSNTYTLEQQKIIEKFRNDMAEAGALVPDYWTGNSAYEIARAAVEAVRRFDQSLKDLKNPEKNLNETLREKLIRCGWVTEWKADTLVSCIESFYESKRSS